jgi:hypothetical protein
MKLQGTPRPCDRGLATSLRRAFQDVDRRDIINKLNVAINAAIAGPRLKARLAGLGSVPVPMTPAEYGKFIASETEKSAKVVGSPALRRNEPRRQQWVLCHE